MTNLVVVSGPSGAGKSTLLERVLGEIPALRFSISHTTRGPRPGEKDGVEYHFTDRPGFQALIDGGLVNNIPADVLVSMGCNFVIAISVTGVLSIFQSAAIGFRFADRRTSEWMRSSFSTTGSTITSGTKSIKPTVRLNSLTRMPTS